MHPSGMWAHSFNQLHCADVSPNPTPWCSTNRRIIIVTSSLAFTGETEIVKSLTKKLSLQVASYGGAVLRLYNEEICRDRRISQRICGYSTVSTITLQRKKPLWHLHCTCSKLYTCVCVDKIQRTISGLVWSGLGGFFCLRFWLIKRPRSLNGSLLISIFPYHFDIIIIITLH